MPNRAFFTDTVTDEAGVPISGASVRVESPGTNNLVGGTLYDSAGATLANPLTTNDAGTVEFYMDDAQTVELAITASGKTARELSVSVSLGGPTLSFSGQTERSMLRYHDTAWQVDTLSTIANTVYVDDFYGAFSPVHDGTTHPLSGYYGSLAAAQVVYPHVTALTQEIDWAAIQGAINSLDSTGDGTVTPSVLMGTVRLGVGVYCIRDSICLRNGVTLEGEGHTASIIYMLVTNTDSIHGDTTTTTPTDSVGVKHIGIRGQNGNTSGCGIYLDDGGLGGGANHFVIEDVFVRWHYDGIKVKAGVIGSIRDCNVSLANNDGFVLETSANDVGMSNCYAQLCTRYGYNITSPSYCTWNNVSADGGSDDGFYATGCYRSSLIDCGFEGNAGHQVHLVASLYITLQGVYTQADETDKHGFCLEGCQAITFIGSWGGNYAPAASGYGLYLGTDSGTGWPSQGIVLINTGLTGVTAGANTYNKVLTLGNSSNGFFSSQVAPGYLQDWYLTSSETAWARYQKQGVATFLVGCNTVGFEIQDGDANWLLGIAEGAPHGLLKLDTDGLEIGSGGTPITKHLSGTATWDPGNVANGASATKAVTVTGAAVGNTVLCGFPLLVSAAAAPVGFQISGQVTATNTVTVTLTNHTGDAVDLDSGTLRADVWQH